MVEDKNAPNLLTTQLVTSPASLERCEAEILRQNQAPYYQSHA